MPKRRTHFPVIFGILVSCFSAGCGDTGGPEAGNQGSRVLRFNFQTPVTAKLASDIIVLVLSDTTATADIDTTFSGVVHLSFLANPVGASFRGADSVFAHRGIADFRSLAIGAAGIGFQLRATAGSLVIDSPVFDAVPTPLDHMALVRAPSSIIAGTVFTPSIRVAVFDLSWDTATNFTGQVTVDLQTNPGGDSLRGTLTRAAVAGVATFDDLMLTRADSGYLLRAQSSGLPDAFGPPFAIRGSAPIALEFIGQPVGAPANGQFYVTPSVAALDSFGNVTRAFAGFVDLAIGLNPSGAALRGTVRRLPTLGVVAFPDIAVTLPGTGYTLVASTPTLPAVTSIPFDVAINRYTRISAGQTHTCAGTPNFCWGDGAAGQLNDGLSGAGHRSLVPRQLTDRSPNPGISAGNDANCVLEGAQTVGCWGGGISPDSIRGVQLGAGLAGFDSVTVGQGYGCGLHATGNTWCFTRANPQGGMLATLVNPGRPFRSAAVGSGFACGLGIDSLAYCVGTLDAPGISPSPIVYASPTAVPGGLRFASIAAGGSTACGVTAAGPTWCWGENGTGQFGNGGVVSDTVPQQVGGGQFFAQLSVGGERSGATAVGTVCGLTLTGQAYCWGDNTDGVLGNGQSGFSTTPQPVQGSRTFSSITVAGGVAAHACALQLDGSAWCWGNNDFGQLGDGTTIARSAPVPVP